MAGRLEGKVRLDQKLKTLHSDQHEGKVFLWIRKISTRASLFFLDPSRRHYVFCLDGLKDVDVGSRGPQQNCDC